MPQDREDRENRSAASGACGQLPDLEVTLTNRFKGATHTFRAQFEAVAGGRILHLWGGEAEEVHLFKMTKPAK